jgi:IclR family acetate operon transcriptional repressor
MLAGLPDEQIQEFLRRGPLKAFTSKTITCSLRFGDELALIQARGYAVDDEEREEGLRCIGAPVRDHAGKVVAAVSIAGPAFRIRAARTKTLAAPVMRAAVRISAALGYRQMKESPLDSAARL